MNDAVTRDLLEQLGSLNRRSAKPRIGVVTATAPLTITLGGATDTHANVKRLSSYTPVISDTVLVLTWGNTLVVVGKIV